MESSRLPGKAMKPIHCIPMIEHCYWRTQLCRTLDDVYVATPNIEIFDYITSIGGQAVITGKHHPQCTDRVAEAVKIIENGTGRQIDIVVMVQGDEPMVTPKMINETLEPFINKGTEIVSLMAPIDNGRDFHDPNVVKVVTDKSKRALYFSREPIPTHKMGTELTGHKMVSVVAFRAYTLQLLERCAETPLEIAEQVNMMRFVENGFSVQMVETKEKTLSVDTQDDFNRVVELMENDFYMKAYGR